MSRNIDTATQSNLASSFQNALYRHSSKSQGGTTTSNVRRSPSPKPASGTNASQSLLANGPSSPGVTRLSPPVGQFVLNTLLQIAGIVAAIAFGIYAVQSVTVGKGANQYANDANQLANISNQLALLGFCFQSGNQTDAVASVCSIVTYYAASALPELASSVFTNLPAAVPTSGSPPPAQSSEAASPEQGSSSGSGVLVGIVIGSLVGLFVIVACLTVWIKRRRAQKYASVAAPAVATSDEKQNRNEVPMSIAQSFRRLFMETRVVTDS